MKNGQGLEQYPIDEESLRKYLIEKEQVDEKLWEKIEKKARGKRKDRIDAIKFVFNNYRKIPIEADDILKALASHEQPVTVRTALARCITKNRTEIPATLYFDLITTLSQDPEAKVKGIVLPEIKEWFEPLVQLQETFKKIEDFKQKPIYKEFEFNWLTFLSFDQMVKLLKMHKDGKDNEIRCVLTRVAKNETFLKNFTNDLSSISMFQPRLAVLEDSLKAHVDHKFTLSIPCLLAQIEGVLWDIACKKGFAVGTTITTVKGKKRAVKGAYALVDETSMYDLMTEHLAEFFLKGVYTHTFRHAILHGRNPNYAKEEDSMKLIMLLRALIEIAKNC